SVLPIVRELGVPALMMGFAYPLANAITQDTAHAVGRRAGLLYVANTVGAVVGSLAVGFWLLPALGMQRTVTMLALAVLAGVAPLCAAARSSRAPQQRRVAWAPAGALCWCSRSRWSCGRVCLRTSSSIAPSGPCGRASSGWS